MTALAHHPETVGGSGCSGNIAHQKALVHALFLRRLAQFLADIDRAIQHAQCTSFNQPELDQPLHIVIDIAVIAPELPGQLTN